MGLQNENNFFSLDISEQSLRLVQLKKSGKKINITAFNQIDIPKDIVVQGEVKDIKKMASLIQKLVTSTNGKKIKAKNVISVLPEAKTFIKVINVSLPEKSKLKDELPKLVQTEIVKYFPLDINDIYLDWQILKETGNNIQLLVGAVSNNISNSYISAIEEAGYSPLILEIEAAPIIRSLITKDDATPKIIIDFGASRTGLIVYDHSTVQFTTSLPTSGRKISETIAKNLNLDLKKAEKAKIVCGLDKEKCEGALRKVLDFSISKLAGDVKKNITYYQATFPGASEIKEVILCGGGANFLKIDEVLKEKLGIPVTIGDPLIKNVINKKNGIPPSQILSYTTAIGLSLRGFATKE